MRLLFRRISQIQTFEGGLFSNGGGYFPFFTENRSQKHKKHAILHTSQANGRGLEPLPPPPGYATVCSHFVVRSYEPATLHGAPVWPCHSRPLFRVLFASLFSGWATTTVGYLPTMGNKRKVYFSRTQRRIASAEIEQETFKLSITNPMLFQWAFAAACDILLSIENSHHIFYKSTMLRSRVISRAGFFGSGTGLKLTKFRA